MQYARDGEGGQTRLRMKRDVTPKVDRPKSTYVTRWKPHEHLDMCVYCGKAWACKQMLYRDVPQSVPAGEAGEGPA